MATSAPLIVSLGDSAGIGPELIAQSWVERITAGLPPFAVMGGVHILQQAAATRGIDLPVSPVTDIAQAAELFANSLPVLEIGDIGDVPYQPGRPDRASAALALSSLDQATRLAVAGKAGGLVTGPIAKANLAEIGFTFPGQTEFVAHACKLAATDAVMMLAGPSLKTVPLTVHVALKEVPHLISADLICKRAIITQRALQQDFGMARPHIAIVALNPHAGENGRFGDEEARIIAPAIASLRAQGVDVSGPHPADALFAPHNRASFDVAICMYHDQALIPIKALDFDAGVNMTLGLPIVRTSPDHGTAFAIAGQNKAHPGATIAAIRMASDAAQKRAQTA